MIGRPRRRASLSCSSLRWWARRRAAAEGILDFGFGILDWGLGSKFEVPGSKLGEGEVVEEVVEGEGVSVGSGEEGLEPLERLEEASSSSLQVSGFRLGEEDEAGASG